MAVEGPAEVIRISLGRETTEGGHRPLVAAWRSIAGVA
jgi:hypothetical protein